VTGPPPPCPVTESLFPKPERSGDVLRYIFPDITKLVLRMSIALASSDSKDLEIAFNWTDWGAHPGTFIARADGSPNCYFLGPSAEYHENISFVEVKAVSFSSLRSEYVSRDCPMPQLAWPIHESMRLQMRGAEGEVLAGLYRNLKTSIFCPA